MKFYNICSKQTYKKKDGTEKTNWLKVGILKEGEDGKKYVSLNLVPNESFYVFEMEEKQEAQPPVTPEQARKELGEVPERFRFDRQPEPSEADPMNVPF